MVRNRVISFPRQIIVCLSLSLIIFLFALSCQKDDGIKPKDPSALTTAQAKDYFEQTAQTLKFITAGITPTGTKNADNSFTSNMVLEWNQALEGEDADCYLVEVPIRMVTTVKAVLYDAIGNINNNIREVDVFVSLVIMKNKNDGCVSSLVVSNVGSFSATSSKTQYCVLCNKDTFSGYQIFSKENGDYYSSFVYNEGIRNRITLIPQYLINRIDSLGHDLSCAGISFVYYGSLNTKGGDGGLYSGENLICPNCNAPMTVISNHYAECSGCGYTIGGLISSEICPICNYPYEYDDLYSNGPGRCKCCTTCNQYPCICTSPSMGCPQCGSFNCNGSSCQTGQHGGDGEPDFTYLISTIILPSSQFGYINKTPSGEYIEGGIGVHMSAIAYPGYHFVEWRKDNVFYSSNCSISFIANGNHCFSALFAED